MKKTFLILCSFALFASVRCFPVVAPVVLTSCNARLDSSGVYAGNPTLYATDASINAAVSVLDVFVKYEYDNRAYLHPDVTKFANKVRVEAPPAAKSAIALRDVYAASPTPENKDKFDKSLRIIRELVSQAALYLVEKPKTP